MIDVMGNNMLQFKLQGKKIRTEDRMIKLTEKDKSSK